MQKELSGKESGKSVKEVAKLVASLSVTPTVERLERRYSRDSLMKKLLELLKSRLR